MKKTYRLLANEQKLLISTLEKLVAADSSQNEVRVITICEKFLQKINIRSQKFILAKSRPNLVWSLGQGKEILIAAHSDVVPAGENWKSSPFKVLKKKKFLIGRGVVDNKSPLAGMLLATKILKKNEDKLKNKITFAAVADEERGNKFGMDFLLAKKIFPKLVGAIIPDSCGKNREIEIAEKGVLQIKITAFGKQGHSSLPSESTNAILILKDFLREVRKLKFSRKTKLLTPTTISITSFHAGVATNIIPGEASAAIDIRFPPNESKSNLLAKIKKIAERESKKWRVSKFRFEILADLPSSETSENSQLVKLASAAIQKISHKKAKIIGMPAFTFAGVLRARKIPTVAFGPGKLKECHRANEKVLESEVIEFTEILIEILQNIELK